MFESTGSYRFAHWLRDQVSSHGTTLHALGQALPYPRKRIYRWADNEAVPNLEAYRLIVAELAVEPEDAVVGFDLLAVQCEPSIGGAAEALDSAGLRGKQRSDHVAMLVGAE